MENLLDFVKYLKERKKYLVNYPVYPAEFRMLPQVALNEVIQKLETTKKPMIWQLVFLQRSPLDIFLKIFKFCITYFKLMSSI